MSEPVRGRRPTLEGRRRRWAVAAAVLLLALFALGGIVVAVEAGGNGETSAAPCAAAIRRVHVTMHAIDSACSGMRPALRQTGRLVRDAHKLADFARAYPRAQFRIDDEDARAISVLLVARETLKTCAPRAAVIVDGALPAGMRVLR